MDPVRCVCLIPGGGEGEAEEWGLLCLPHTGFLSEMPNLCSAVSTRGALGRGAPGDAERGPARLSELRAAVTRLGGWLALEVLKCAAQGSGVSVNQSNCF